MINETDLGDKGTGRKSRPTITLEKGPAGPVTDELRLQLSERIHRNELFAFVEIDADALKRKASFPMLAKLSGVEAAPKASEPAAADGSDRTAPVRVHMESIAYNEVGRWLAQAINQAAFALRLQDAGLDPAVVAFGVRAVMLSGSIFVAVGAACSDIKEREALLPPVMVVVILPLMAGFPIGQEPLSSFPQWTSLFPLATPMLMLLRMAASPMVPW